VFETLLAVLKETKNNHHETPTFLLYSRVCLRKSLTAHGTQYSSLSLSLLGTDEDLGRCLGNDSRGSSNSVCTMGNWGMSISSMSNWGMGISTMGNSNWGSVGNSNWNLSNSVDWSSNSLGNSLDGVGTGFVDNWLVDGLVGTDGSSDGLGSIGGDILEDGLSDVVGLDDGSRLVGGNGGGDVGVGCLSDRVGQGGDLGDDLSEGMSLGGGVGKVATQPVVLDGSRVMGWGTHEVGGCISNNNSVSTAVSNQTGEEQEGIHGGGC